MTSDIQLPLCLSIIWRFHFYHLMVFTFSLFLYINLDISTLSDVYLIKVFSYSVDYPVFQMSFSIQKLFSFMKSQLLIICLSDYANTILFRKSFLMPVSSKILPTSPSIMFNLPGFMLMHLELSSIQSDK